MSPLLYRLISAIVLMSLLSCATHPDPRRNAVSQKTWSWLERGPGSALMVRALTGKKECPELRVNGEIKAMNRRGLPSSAFPIEVCELNLSDNTAAIEVDGHLLSRPKSSKDIRKIAILGDTGCRIKVKDGKARIQACNNAQAWSFARVARVAADWHPDLVIHMGDYLYRESPCPLGHPECEGSPFGDRWETWEADFFSPAAPLLNEAPWIFVRGNHELCERAGSGWFRLLDSRPISESCSNATPPWLFPLAKSDLAIVDGSDDKNVEPSLRAIEPQVDRPFWLLVHRPFLTPHSDKEATVNPKLPRSFELPGRASVAITGHVHLLSFNRFEDARPAELIVGNGGTLADPLDLPFLKQKGVFANPIAGAGFVTFERRADDSWTVVARDQNGSPQLTCVLQESKVLKASYQCESRDGEGKK